MYQIYHRLARDFGLEMSPADPGVFTFTIDLWGTVGGRSVRVHRHVGRGGYALVRTPLDPPVGIGIGVAPTALWNHIGALFGMQDIEVGIRDFDRAFQVRAREEARVREVLSPAVCAALLGIPAEARMSDVEVEASVGHRDESYDVLAGMIRWVVEVARLVRPR